MKVNVHCTYGYTIGCKRNLIITRKDGSKFKLVSITQGKKTVKSPLETIEGVKSDVTMKDILQAIRDGRER